MFFLVTAYYPVGYLKTSFFLIFPGIVAKNKICAKYVASFSLPLFCYKLFFMFFFLI